MNKDIESREAYEEVPYEVALIALLEFEKASEWLVELGTHMPEEAPMIEAIMKVAKKYGLEYEEVLDDIEELQGR